MALPYHHVVVQGSAIPGTRATCGTRENFSWHAKRFDAHAKLCISLDNFCVDDVCSGSASHSQNWLAVRAKKLAHGNPVHASSY